MSGTYKIIVEQEGVNHIKIFKAKGDGFVSYWNIALKGDDEPIVFFEFYTETQFIIMNWNGWVRAYDATTKQQLFDHNLNGSVNAKAVLSSEKSRLHIALTADSGANQLIELTLDSFKKETVELPDIYDGLLQLRKDGSLLFYKQDWLREGDIKVYKHFYSVLDINTKNIEQYELAYAPQFSFGEFKPVVDIEHNSVIMPAYDDVVHKTNINGEIIFEFRIALFDLNTFELLHVLSVRDFTASQLGCSEYECEEMAEVFISSDRKMGYYESSREFYENLKTIKIVTDGFWLCWRGGILRKIDLNFNMSALLVTSSRSNNTDKGMFQHPYFHSHLLHIDNSSVVLAEALDFYTSAIPDLNAADFKIPIGLDLEKSSLDKIYNLSYSTDQRNEISNRDYILIEVTDLSKKKGFADALVQIETIVSDLHAAGIGSILLFLIKDKKGITLQEPEFFSKAVNHDAQRIQSIIHTFIEFPKAEYIYRNSEETALCYAVLELAKKGNTYLTTILQYLAAIDLDHDVFNKEYIFPMLEENYKHEELLKNMKSISKELAEWYKYYCEG